MSLSFFQESDSAPVGHFGKRTLYLSSKVEPDSFPKIELPPGHEFNIAHDNSQEREVCYLTAPAGAGKSFLACEYIKDYHKCKPKNDVYVFSSLSDDKTLDKLKYLKRINIASKDFLETELDAKEFKDSLVVFDDIDCIQDKKVLKKVQAIMTSILLIGRHDHVSCIYISHKATNGKETSYILSEAHKIIIFPSCAGGKTLDYVGGQYLGFNKKQLEKIKTVKSRWLCVMRKFPRCILTQHEAYLMSEI